MKDTELQIGDWMDWPKSPFANPHFYSQVVALDRGGISPCIGIPLTPEILEKNGWKFIEGQDYSTFPVPSKWTYQFVPFALRVDGEHYTIANTFSISICPRTTARTPSLWTQRTCNKF